jgi:hypothetical protein
VLCQISFIGPGGKLSLIFQPPAATPRTLARSKIPLFNPLPFLVYSLSSGVPPYLVGLQ